MNTVENFRAAMRAADLPYAGSICVDGKLHRIKAEGDKSRNSWYVFHPCPPTAGAFGCWKRGIKETWSERHGQFSQTDWNTVRQLWREADAHRKRAEIERHEKAQRVAAWILQRAKPLMAHAYLKTKNVHVFGNVREYRGAVVLPLRAPDDNLYSLQFIRADGSKNFLSGGRVAGCFFAVAENSEGPLVVCEGYATGATVHEATGLATVAAMNCGNLLAVAKSLRVKWPEREIILAADNDQWTHGNPGVAKATEAAKTVCARLAVPQFRDTDTKPTDFNDLVKLEGLNAVKIQIANAATSAETDDELFQRLAKLTPAEYDRLRENEADRARVRVGTLDGEVAKRRPKDAAEDNTQGPKVSFPELEPWPYPVNGADLLNEITLTLERFVVAPAPAFVAASLFVLHTYAFDLGDISPILFITGPTKRCGKSKFLAILLRMVARAFSASSATPAGIYRMIELHHPTLCIDEVDTFVAANEQLRGLINSGHTRDAAYHLGCAGTGDKDFEPRRWSTWTPKIFSGIGRLADTIEDRAVILQMARRRKDEPCERLRHGMRFDDIPRKCLRFVKDNAEAIKSGDPSVPHGLNDRAADNWTPLLGLADLAGGGWPAKARQSAIAFSGGDDGESLGVNVQLLADIRDVFTAAGVDKLASKDMAERLTQIEGRPWAEYGKQRRPISPNQLANLLRDFGVSSRTVRVGNSTPKGYYVGDFADAFSRWLPESGHPERNNATSLASVEENASFQGATPTARCVSKNADSTNKEGACCVVADGNGENDADKVYV